MYLVLLHFFFFSCVSELFFRHFFDLVLRLFLPSCSGILNKVEKGFWVFFHCPFLSMGERKF